MPDKPRLSLAIITLNEEKKLGDCLRSAAFVDEIIVVDSGSTDKTKEVAASFNARFVTRPFDNFARQKNTAIEHCAGEWILLLDADERLSPELAAEIQAVIADPRSLGAYYVRRRNFLFGGRMRYGANLNDWQLRLLKRGQGHFEGIVHERVKPDGEAGYLKGDLLHYSYQTLEEYFKKFPLFSDLDAESMWRQGKKPGLAHFLARPPLNFCYFYFYRLGFLDGFRGLLYEALAANYLYTKYRKVLKLYRERGPAGQK